MSSSYDVSTAASSAPPRIQTMSSGVAGSTITFHKVRYTVSVKDPHTTFGHMDKEILREIDGIFKPGMNAIMGPTGGGKSSLLDILAGRKDPVGLAGHVLVDGKEQPKDFKNRSGYVVQDDIVMGTLSIRENFMFSANLRLPSSVSKEEKERRVEETLNELGLHFVADSRVGNEFVRGISGGERKRTNIGLELLIAPSVLFLDEPTTGLDANTANATMALLKRLSRRGRTVILSIHQPRFSIYKLFDSLLFLGRGRTIYHGPAHDAIVFFDQFGYKCETFNNPPDFFLDAINGDVKPVLKQRREAVVQNTHEVDLGVNNGAFELEAMGPVVEITNASPAAVVKFEVDDDGNKVFLREERSDELADSYLNTHWHTELQEELYPIFSEYERSKVKRGEYGEGYHSSFLVQLAYVSYRAMINLIRSPEVSVVQTVAMAVIALVMGILYFQLDNSFPTDIQNRAGVLFFTAMNAVFSNMSALDMFINERPIFIHQNISGYFRVSSYFLGKMLCDVLPMRLIPITLYSLIIYFMIGLQPDAGKFFFFLLNMFLTSFTATAIGFFISASVVAFATANLSFTIIMIFMLLFGGFLVNLNTMAAWLSWIQYLSLFRYSFNAFLINEMKDMEFCEYGEYENGTSWDVCYPESGNMFLESQGIKYETAWHMWANEVGLVLMAVIFLAVAYIQMRRIKKLK